MNSPIADPVYVNAKREGIIILVIWALGFAWTVPYCYFTGFQTTTDNWELTMTWGIPSWIFWGVAFPWFVSGVLSILMCLFYIKDDDLGQAEDELPLSE